MSQVDCAAALAVVEGGVGHRRGMRAGSRASAGGSEAAFTRIVPPSSTSTDRGTGTSIFVALGLDDLVHAAARTNRAESTGDAGQLSRG